MPYDKPGITELIDQQFADLLSLLKDADPTLRDSKLEIFAKVMAGGLNGGYSYLDWVLLQIFPDTADAEYSGKWGATKNLVPLDAQSASGTVLMTGTTEGAGCLEGDQLRRDDGVLFATTESAVLTATLNISVGVAAVDPGVAGNTDVGELLTWVSTPEDINSTASVEDMTGGTDDETDAEYTARVVDSFRNPARGGSETDYITWAKEADDVTNVWVKAFENPNTFNILLGDLDLYFMMYDTYDDGVPESGNVTKVQDYIDDRRPMGMGDFTAIAPTPVPLTMSLTISPDTLQGREEIEEQLADYVRRNAEPYGILYLSNINEAISRAISVDYHTMTVLNGVTPPGDTVQPVEVYEIFSFTATNITWNP